MINLLIYVPYDSSKTHFWENSMCSRIIRTQVSHTSATSAQRNSSKKFTSQITLRFHKLKKGNMCSECGQMFLTARTLKKHFNPQKIFKRKDKLNNKLSIHTGIRPFLCDLCPKKFITKSKLKEYQRRHLGEKRFSCLLCSKLYSGSHDLRKHLEKTHPKVAKNILPNVPLTPQIISNLSQHL